MKRSISLVTLIAICFVSFDASPMLSPCYDKFYDYVPSTTGCPAISKTQLTQVYFKDGHSTYISQGPASGGCGTYVDGCINCSNPTYLTRQCWPRFLSPCPGNYQEPGSNCWVGTWGREVYNQTANTGSYYCGSGCSIPTATCADAGSTWYSVEHTCTC